MKILFLNTYDSRGGSAIAARRIMNALREFCEVKFGCILNEDNNFNSLTPFSKRINKYLWLFNLAKEKALFLPFEKSKKERFAFSTAVSGINPKSILRKYPADILHIHWFNQGFLSLKSVGKISKNKQPVVWTLHDMWAFTGGCHYTSLCKNYMQSCGNCPMLRKSFTNDISNKQWKLKKKIFEAGNFTFVTCSAWLKTQAKQSSLLSKSRIEVIPNPIDTDIFHPVDRGKACTFFNLDPAKKYIYFTAGNIADTRKGFFYFEQAIQLLKQANPGILKNAVILLSGKNTNRIERNLSIEANYLGYLSSVEELVNAYNAASLFVLPSLEDNLPNSIMEALACGTPCVGFKTGGIPEMIVHKNTGYLAEYKSVEDLAEGISWILIEDSIKLSESARNFALNHYSQKVIGQMYYNLYQSVLQ